MSPFGAPRTEHFLLIPQVHLRGLNVYWMTERPTRLNHAALCYASR